jgi:hypothetical protein
VNISSKRVLKLSALSAAFVAFTLTGVGVLPPRPATAAAAPAVSERAQHWSAWGGTVGVRWNRDLAQDLGLTIGPASARHAELSWYEHEVFDLRQAGSLEFDVRNGNLRGFVGGSLQAFGGHVIETPSGRIDLTHFRLVPRLGSSPPLLDLVSADGRAWFTIDRLMYELIDDKQRLAVRTMDLRITPELAARIGRPEVAGWAIADMELTTQVLRRSDDPMPQGAYVPRWHGSAVAGVPGAVHEADLFMQTFSAQYSRCNGCTGDGGNGQVVFTPSSTLRNNVNYGSASPTVAGDPLGTSSALYTADIPWYAKFSGDFPPYNNDQHPYLIWNLYRLNADGSIEQIGRSGVKHAFLTLNTTCIEDPNDSHILGRGCSDVYSVGNNDSSNALGPRSEIVPASNVWGRCGSIYDTNCDGIPNASGNGSYDQRLVVRESQFSGPAHAGATYLFESWYLARGDTNILNSMGTKRVTFTRSGSVWVVGGNDQYRLGPAIDRWVNPAQPGPGAVSVMLRTAEGNVKLAGRATDLGGGRWRYEYAVMNLDFARALTQGSEPNLRVLSNLGFNRFTLPVGSSTITDVAFSDGDLDASNDWTAAVAGRNIAWSAPSGQALNWGTMFRFSFVANHGPVKSPFSLEVATPGTPQVLKSTGMIAPAPARVLGPAGIGG